MAREPSAAIIDPLRRLVTRQTGSSLPDAQLLENFVSRRDEASFEVLVWRHGAMVLSLCKRVLRDRHEAEDAFQATFLVFARKAGSIGKSEAVACWLYKVAYRIAIRLRAAAAKRQPGTTSPDELPAPDVPDDAEWRDLRPVLDDEIAKLPEKYRAPFVLCYLEGRTNEEAAAQLGCPKGTVLSRLSRGRERLRERLARRGVALSVTTLALTLDRNAASAALSAALVPPVINAAVPFVAGKVAIELVPAHVAALTDGVLRAMKFTNLKTATLVLLSLCVLGTGITWAALGDGQVPAPDEPVALVGAPTTPVEGPRERPVAPAAVGLKGDVVAVAKDEKSFTIKESTDTPGADGRTVVVKFGAKAAVTYRGVGPGGAKPTAGYYAWVSFQEGSKDVAATVEFNGPEIATRDFDLLGKVSSIAKDGTSITFGPEVERGNVAPDPKLKTTIAFDARTVLSFSGVARDGATLTIGHLAVVWNADDGRTAGKVEFMGEADERRPNERRPDAVGKVTRAAADGKKIVIEVPPTERGAEPTRITVTISDEATTVFNDVPLDGAKIAPGLQAQVWLADGEKEVATKVVFTGTVPERWTVVTGKVVAVAKDGNSFTVEPSAVRGEEPKRVEIKLTAKTKQAYFGVGTGETKPVEGLNANVRLLDDAPDTAGRVNFFK